MKIKSWDDIGLGFVLGLFLGLSLLLIKSEKDYKLYQKEVERGTMLLNGWIDAQENYRNCLENINE